MLENDAAGERLIVRSAAISINLELDVNTVAKTITQDYLLRR